MKNQKQLQVEIGTKIGAELSEKLQGAKVEVCYINLRYKKDRGYTFYIYSNQYDYRKITVNYVPGVTIENYTNFIIGCLNNEDECVLNHVASSEEKYVVDIINRTNAENLYVIDGRLMGEGFEIGLDDNVEYLSYNKLSGTLEIQSAGEKFEIDLVKENIIFVNEYEPEAKPINNNFMHKVCNSWNQIKGIWAILLYSDEDECLRIKDIETGNITDLVGLDNINYIRLNEREKKICVEYVEDEHGFTGFELSLAGIEY